jgi:hypothetical protein
MKDERVLSDRLLHLSIANTIFIIGTLLGKGPSRRGSMLGLNAGARP